MKNTNFRTWTTYHHVRQEVYKNVKEPPPQELELHMNNGLLNKLALDWKK